MAFGSSKNKKRESWSSRPLSMILSDNVWLFKNKGRNSVEKALQQQPSSSSNKHIESSKPSARQPSTAPSHGPSSHSTAPGASTEAVHTPVKTPKADSAKREASKSSESTKSATKDEQAPPFLTLDLDVSPQRLDVPEQYLDESTISQDFYSQTGNSPEPGYSSDTVLPESILGPLGGLSVQGQEATKSETTPTEHSTTDVMEANNATDSSSDGLSQDSFGEPSSEQSGMTRATEATRESTVDSGNSVSTVDAATKSDSFLLGSNRKVVVGRGVYIFDPAEPGAAQELKLSAAESFNPFEFE